MLSCSFAPRSAVFSSRNRTTVTWTRSSKALSAPSAVQSDCPSMTSGMTPGMTPAGASPADTPPAASTKNDTAETTCRTSSVINSRSRLSRSSSSCAFALLPFNSISSRESWLSRSALSRKTASSRSQIRFRDSITPGSERLLITSSLCPPGWSNVNSLSMLMAKLASAELATCTASSASAVSCEDPAPPAFPLVAGSSAAESIAASSAAE